MASSVQEGVVICARCGKEGREMVNIATRGSETGFCSLRCAHLWLGAALAMASLEEGSRRPEVVA